MTVSGGAPVLASDVNEALNRRIGKAQSVSDWPSGITSTETCTESVTVTVKGGRTYEIAGYFPVTGNNTTDDFFVLLRQGATASDAQLTYDRIHFDVANAVYVAQPKVEWTASADGTVTFGMFVRRVTGTTTTATPKGATSQPRYMTVTLATSE